MSSTDFDDDEMQARGWRPPKPPGNGDDGWPDGNGELCRDTVEMQARTIRYLLSNYNALLTKVERERPDGPRPPGPWTRPDPWTLQGGPWPLEVGSVPPTQVKVWFNTVAGALQVWRFSDQTWVPVAPTVAVGATPPSPAPLGTLYLDPQPKLWVHIDDWRELTQPITGGPVVQNGAVLVSSFTPPSDPPIGSLWFEPRLQHLSVWNGSTWLRIGTRVERAVRIPNWINTWNAGGNRSQGARAGELLYVAGMRGINPVTQQQEVGPGVAGAVGAAPYTDTTGGLVRNNRIWSNIQVIVEAEGLTLQDCYGITTAVTNLAYLGVTVQSEAQPQFFGLGPYPPRTHEVWLQMSGSDTIEEFPIAGWPVRGDITEITAMFYTGRAGRRRPTTHATEIRAIPGVTVAEGMPAGRAAPIPTQAPGPELTPEPERPPPRPRGAPTRRR